MNNFTQELTKDINKIVGTLKSEEILKETLKKKLTKKEFKYLKLTIENADEETIAKELQCDAERFEAIKKQTISKLNQEKIKKELLVL
jgi:DNA-binding CsgD family transcriptional regulator